MKDRPRVGLPRRALSQGSRRKPEGQDSAPGLGVRAWLSSGAADWLCDLGKSCYSIPECRAAEKV